MTKSELEAIRARCEAALLHFGKGDSEPLADIVECDIPALLAEVDRLRAAFNSAIAQVESFYPFEIFPKDGTSQDCLSANACRQTCKNVRRALAEALGDE